ncbi:MAG: 3',5'-cyclic-nucleotide phosphodiesterase [bacterium]
MKLRVLGCFGGSAPGMRLTSYLIDERIAVDAGSLTEPLAIREQARITHLFISHCHIDHLVTLPFLLDNVLPWAENPITLWGPQETIRNIEEHLFNGSLWPDFTRIPNEKKPILRMQALAPGQTIEAHGLAITPFALDHMVACHGHLIQAPGAAVAICSDTASLDGLVRILPQAVGLKAVILEASFPRRLARIAELSRHLSTDSFAREAARIPSDVPLLVCHLKPDCVQEITGEVRGLGMKNVSFLEQDREYLF